MTDRYSRQTKLTEIGEEGQKKLAGSRAVIVGCGALGCIISTTLARAGVGRLRIIDKDIVEIHNLQRQVAFDEDDVAARRPKAEAAERYLKKVNSSIETQGIVDEVNAANIEEYVRDADIIMDGLDNYKTRFLVNDAALKLGIPWVYGGAVMTSGMVMTIIPGETACFRCLAGSETEGARAMTADTVGIIAPSPSVVGSLQCAEALKILIGSPDINRDLAIINVWAGTIHRVKIIPSKTCPACQGTYEFLNK